MEIIRHVTRQRVLANDHEEFAPDCPPALKQLVLECCAQSPDRRPEPSQLLEKVTEIRQQIEKSGINNIVVEVLGNIFYHAHKSTVCTDVIQVCHS